jgi:hypothetical protein
MEDYRKTQEDLETVRQQYKSLQGQFKDFNPVVVQAQMAEMQRLLTAATTPKQESPKAPRLPERVRNLFGDAADEFEQATIAQSFSQAQEYKSQLEQLRAEIADLKKDSVAAPFAALRATNADIYNNPKFDSYLRNTVDEFGVSQYDRIVALGAQSSERGLGAMAQAAKLFQKTLAPKDAQQTQQEQSLAPRLSPNGATAPRTAPGNERKAAELRAAYAKLDAQPLTEATLKQRLALVGQARQLNIELSD